MRRFDMRTGAGDGDGTRPLGELFHDLSSDAATLLRQELALARAEVGRGLRALAREVGTMAAWGVVGALGGLVLVAFLVAGLGDLLDNYWLASLLVGLLFVGTGGSMALRSLRRLRDGRVRPRETVETLRDTRAWAQAEAAGLRAALAGARGNGQASADGGGGSGAPAAPVGVRTHGRVYAAGTGSPGQRTATGGAAERPPAPRKPARGLRGLAKRVWTDFREDDVPGQAAKVAYYFFLSLPPALMAVFALTGMFGGAEFADRISAELRSALPGEASTLVDDFVRQVVLETKPGLLSLGLLLALWSASNVFSAFADALNVSYGVRENRSWLKKKAVALGTMLAVAVLFLAGSSALLAGPQIADALGMGRAGELVWGVAQWPLAFLLIASAFWVIYYVLPDKDQSGCRKTLFKASAVAAGLWLLATLAFRVYIANFSSYGETYGFIGGVIVLLLWMYVTSLVVLLGGEVASEMEEGR